MALAGGAGIRGSSIWKVMKCERVVRRHTSMRQGSRLGRCGGLWRPALAAASALGVEHLCCQQCTACSTSQASYLTMCSSM